VTDVVCTLCNRSIDNCTCPETDESLKWAADSTNVMFKWCRACDRHYARCRCEQPDFYLRCGGKEVPIPENGFLTAAGTRVFPDLTKK
jgi:hypothetical protein